MAGRISRMRWRTFGESLRKEIIAISCEASLHRLGVEHVVVDMSLERSAMASQNLAHNRAARLGTVPKMDLPFLIPHAVQRKASDCRHRCRKVGLAEGAEAVLRSGVNVGVPRIPRYTDRVKHQERRKVSLKEHIHMGICGKIASIMEIASLRIQLVLQPGVNAILDLLESCRVRHVVDVRLSR